MSIVTRKRNGTMNKQPLLSICIPTWNRSKYLSISLDRFKQQFTEIDNKDVELLISDNHSDDDTPQVVQSYIKQGLPITYNRNEENIGAAKNFIKCMELASGKYIWLLGDDDFLLPAALKYLIEQMKKGDYGLIHLKDRTVPHQKNDIEISDNKEIFLQEVSYWLTFMSSNIFLKESVPLIENKECYLWTHLLQVPFYLQSSFLRKNNLMIRKPMMDTAADGSSNGGFNYFEVFVKGYLFIIGEGVRKGFYSIKFYNSLKKDIYVKFLAVKIFRHLILKKNVRSESELNKRNGFEIKGAWKILLKNYGFEWYFWVSFISEPVKWFIRKTKGFIAR